MIDEREALGTTLTFIVPERRKRSYSSRRIQSAQQ